MKDRAELTSSAFKVNGVYFEDVIEGYTTLSVKGRELISKELVLQESDNVDGAVLAKQSYPAREMTVEYLLKGDNWSLIQERYLKLMSMLNVSGAEIIFNGEPDKFYIGTLVADEDITKFTIARTGTFRIVCVDPFKYSVNEYQVSPADGVFSVFYDGTYRSYPKFEVQFPLTLDQDGDNTNTSECGYIGFADARGDVLQFGDPEATDWADVTQPATNPLNKTFKTLTDWTLNNSATTSDTSYIQTGTAAANSSGYAYPSGYGSGAKYHGPSISTILTDQTGAKNFDFSWKQKFVGNKSQFGAFECCLWRNDSGTRTLIGAILMIKSTKDTKTKVYFYANGSLSNKYNFNVDCSKIGTCKITKQGEETKSITLTAAGVSKTFDLSESIGDMIVNEVTFWFGKNGTKTAMGTNWLYNCSLKRHSYPKLEDVPNLFQPGDILKINCRDASVTLDSGDSETNAQTIGALGNDWEKFTLESGQNVIAFDYSEWATTPPQAVMKYRKVYL